jgi:hypothetical protein
MVTQREMEENMHLIDLLEALAPRLQTPKAELVAEIERRLSVVLGVEVREAFSLVAKRQRYSAESLNLERAHKSALVLVAHVLAEMMNRTDAVDLTAEITGS